MDSPAGGPVKKTGRNRKKKAFFGDDPLDDDDMEWAELGQRIFAKTVGEARRDNLISAYPSDAPVDSFPERVTRRRDATYLPFREEGGRWAFNPSGRHDVVSVGRDHTCTAENAAKVV